jgi:uncharacterized membrane protein
MDFVHVYFTIGIILYLVIVSLMYFIGVDNIKEIMDREDREDIKNIDINEPMTHVILMFLLIVIWPFTIMWLINENTKNN